MAAVEGLLGDRYQILKSLGKKAGRQTFLAKDFQSDQRVVVKLLRFGGDFEWDDLKLFEREAETLQALSHPAIPRYLDYFELDTPDIKGFALVQSYIQARSLEEQVSAGRTFSEADLKELAIALLEILTYLHERQPPVIHRDIKPSNILLGDPPQGLQSTRLGNSVGQVYLVDFGSVQNLAAHAGGTITVVGTYGYMPPEQFGGRAMTASDLYSLGATLIYLATGQHPADLPQDDLRIQFEQETNLSPSFTRWLKRMTEPSLSRRFRTVREAIEGLDQSLQVRSLTIAEKPAGSRIQLKKDTDSFELVLPSAGLDGSTLFLIPFAIAWNSFVLFWTAMAGQASIFFALFSLPFWTAGISMIVKILDALFEKTYLSIHSDFLQFSRRTLGIRYKKHLQVPVKQVSRLVYIRPSYVDYGKYSTMGQVTMVKPRLTLWCGTRRVDIGGHLSEPEVEWLAQELSEWLGVELSAEQNLPQLGYPFKAGKNDPAESR
jgi:serine/threonine protein kinase